VEISLKNRHPSRMAAASQACTHKERKCRTISESGVGGCGGCIKCPPLQSCKTPDTHIEPNSRRGRPSKEFQVETKNKVGTRKSQRDVTINNYAEMDDLDTEFVESHISPNRALIKRIREEDRNVFNL
jgi:hypothetical protein